MAQFEPVKAEIEAIGSLLFIAAEKRGGLFKPEKYLEEHPISFPFLLDEDRRITKAYSVYQRLGLDAINIARPATFLVNRQRLVERIYVGANQFDRWDVAKLMAAFKSGG